MPGARGLAQVAPERYAGQLQVSFGPLVAADFDLAVTLADVVEPERYTLLVDARGRLGWTRGRVAVRLEAAGAATVMRFAADFETGGAVAVMGQRLLDAVARRLTRQGLAALGGEVEKRLGGG